MNIYRILQSARLAAGLSLGLAALSAADAGCYSDWCANQRSGATSSRITLQYGGAYSQAARNYNNYRWGYGTGRNTHDYSPYYPTGAYPSSRIAPARQADIDRLHRQSEILINRIMTDPLIWR